MKSLTYTLATGLAFLSLASADDKKKDAPITPDNPKRATYQAILQADKSVQGTITGVSNENGTGVNLNVNFFSFPDKKADPFIYHIHVNPIPSDGNCSGTGGHLGKYPIHHPFPPFSPSHPTTSPTNTPPLDPYNATETPACDAKTPSTCQVGDLSGKHGKIDDVDKHPSFQTQYLDLYLSTSNTSEAFFGNRSVVVHAANGTRLNCGNFVLQDGAGSNGTNGGNASYTPTSANATKSGNAAKKTGGASLMQAGMSLALAVGVIGGVFLL